MTDQPDIVERLREYTRHNKPVLSTDLKTAADYIDQLRRELVSAIGQRENRASALSDALDNLDKFTEDVAKAAGLRLNPSIGRSDIVEHIRKIVRDRDALLPQDLPPDDLNVEEQSPSMAGSTISRDEVVRKVRQHDKEVIRAHERINDHGLKFDEVDRRIAELESNMRRTERRLDAAHEAMYDASKVASPSPTLIARSLTRTLARDNDDV